MELIKYEQNGKCIAVVETPEVVISDTQSALDLLMDASYTAGSKAICIPKTAVCEDFFILSTGVAGEILQKFINYGGKIAIYGDYSEYTSKPLKDFIRESNRGKDIFFVRTKEEALERLMAAAE